MIPTTRNPGRTYIVLAAGWVVVAIGLNVLAAAQDLAPGWFVLPPLMSAVFAGRFWLGLRMRADAKHAAQTAGSAAELSE